MFTSRVFTWMSWVKVRRKGYKKGGASLRTNDADERLRGGRTCREKGVRTKLLEQNVLVWKHKQ